MALEVIGVTREYQRGKTTFAAVQNATLSLKGGELISILGRSGSGKSTLLNLAAGLLKPTTGTIRVEGHDLALLNGRQAAQLRNDRIGVVPQGHSVLGNLTVLDNVALPFYLFPRGGDATKQALALLEQMEIAHLAQSWPSELSGGELRRVAIARALINRPALVLADEPTGDLDQKTTAQVMDLFRAVAADGAAVLLVTHDRDALAYSSRTYRMDGGLLEPYEDE